MRSDSRGQIRAVGQAFESRRGSGGATAYLFVFIPVLSGECERVLYPNNVGQPGGGMPQMARSSARAPVGAGVTPPRGLFSPKARGSEGSGASDPTRSA